MSFIKPFRYTYKYLILLVFFLLLPSVGWALMGGIVWGITSLILGSFILILCSQYAHLWALSSLRARKLQGQKGQNLRELFKAEACARGVKCPEVYVSLHCYHNILCIQGKGGRTFTVIDERLFGYLSMEEIVKAGIYQVKATQLDELNLMCISYALQSFFLIPVNFLDKLQGPRPSAGLKLLKAFLLVYLGPISKLTGRFINPNSKALRSYPRELKHTFSQIYYLGQNRAQAPWTLGPFLLVDQTFHSSILSEYALEFPLELGQEKV